MPEPDLSRSPANVRAAALSQRRRRDDNLIRAAVIVLDRELRRLRPSGTGAFVCPDLAEKPHEDSLLKEANLSRKSWYRLCNQGRSASQIHQELWFLARVVEEEHRIPMILLAVPGVSVEGVLMALALNAAREGDDLRSELDPLLADRFRKGLRWAKARTIGSMIGLACDSLVKSGNALSLADIGRLHQHHGVLEHLADQYPGTVVVEDSERRVAGFLAGWAATTSVPPTPGLRGDRSGTWVEGVIDALVLRDRHRLCRDFVLGTPYSTREYAMSGVPAAQYWMERLAVRVLAGPAHATSTKRARAFGRRLAETLSNIDEKQPNHAYVNRRARAIRSYLMGDWDRAFIEAMVPVGFFVKPSLEREYRFSLMAAIAHETASKRGDLREPYTAAFLHSLVARGQGPFMDAPVRQLAKEVDGLAEVSSLTDAVDSLISEEAADELDAAVHQLLIAQAFNTRDDSLDRNNLLNLARRLQKRAAKIEGVATQLELAASQMSSVWESA